MAAELLILAEWSQRNKRIARRLQGREEMVCRTVLTEIDAPPGPATVRNIPSR